MINYKSFMKKRRIEIINGDCIEVMKSLDLSFDMVFADPPFNLKKEYSSKINDNLTDTEYKKFQEEWIKSAVKLLRPGGSIFIYNIPKWNIYASNLLLELGLELRHWIVIDSTFGLPIKNKLYPSHYSLLYFTKGKPKTFNSIRVPIPSCRHCGGDIKDYGGHRSKIHQDGLNLKDVWTDIGKVTGQKNRLANELPEKLLERVINLSTNPGDLILDPFAGSGTTLAVARRLKRDCVGIELSNEDCDLIKKRVA